MAVLDRLGARPDRGEPRRQRAGHPHEDPRRARLDVALRPLAQRRERPRAGREARAILRGPRRALSRLERHQGHRSRPRGADDRRCAVGRCA